MKGSELHIEADESACFVSLCSEYMSKRTRHKTIFRVLSRYFSVNLDEWPGCERVKYELTVEEGERTGGQSSLAMRKDYRWLHKAASDLLTFYRLIAPQSLQVFVALAPCLSALPGNHLEIAVYQICPVEIPGHQTPLQQKLLAFRRSQPFKVRSIKLNCFCVLPNANVFWKIISELENFHCVITNKRSQKIGQVINYNIYSSLPGFFSLTGHKIPELFSFNQ